MGIFSREATLHFSFLPTFLLGVNSQWKEFAPAEGSLRADPISERASVNGKSQNVGPLVNKAEKGGVPIHLKIQPL